MNAPVVRGEKPLAEPAANFPMPGLTVAHFAGIPIRIHWNWFIVAAAVIWSLAVGYLPQQYPGWELRSYWLTAAITALLFFGSVLVHEFGHALIALREGVPVQSITLFIFGGVAHIAHEPRTPGAEFRIVLAGPFASLVLACSFLVVGAAGIRLGAGALFAGPALYLGQVNLILALFNLLPGFPLDGGRLLRALMWRINGDFVRATAWARNAGYILAGGFLLAALFLIAQHNYFNGGWLGFLGWYLALSAREGYRQALFSYEDQVAALSEEPTRPIRQPLYPSTQLGGFHGLPVYGMSGPLRSSPNEIHPPEEPAQDKEMP